MTEIFKTQWRIFFENSAEMENHHFSAKEDPSLLRMLSMGKQAEADGLDTNLHDQIHRPRWKLCDEKIT